MHRPTTSLLRFMVPLIASLSWVACGVGSQSSSPQLTTWQEQLVQEFNWSPQAVAANSDAKTGNVTICHYPPGNRANRHTITVGYPAVAPHVRLHGDTIGPCGAADGGSSGAPGGGSDGGSSGGPGGSGSDGGSNPGGSGSDGGSNPGGTGSDGGSSGGSSDGGALN